MEVKCSLTDTQGGGSFTHLRILNVFSGYMTLVLSGYAIGVSKVFSGEEKKRLNLLSLKSYIPTL